MGARGPGRGKRHGQKERWMEGEAEGRDGGRKEMSNCRSMAGFTRKLIMLKLQGPSCACVPRPST